MARGLSEPLSKLSFQTYQPQLRLPRQGRWFWVALLAALVDGKLFGAIALGGLTYAVLAAENPLTRNTLATYYRWLMIPFSQIRMTPVITGTLVFGATYAFAAAWSDLGGGWAALTLVGLGLVNGAFLLKRLIPGSEFASSMVESDPLAGQWQNLSAPESVKRLMAVRSLVHWSLTSTEAAAVYWPGTAVTVRSHLMDCLRLMLSQESEPVVRAALVEGLQALQPKPQLIAGQPAIQPLVTKIAVGANQRAVDYVEP